MFDETTKGRIMKRTQAGRVLQRFGNNPYEMSRNLGISRGTIRYWLEQGTIPVHRHAALCKRANELLIDLKPEEFVADLAEMDLDA